MPARNPHQQFLDQCLSVFTDTSAEMNVRLEAGRLYTKLVIAELDAKAAKSAARVSKAANKGDSKLKDGMDALEKLNAIVDSIQDEIE
jgi:hypothetical protein